MSTLDDIIKEVPHERCSCAVLSDTKPCHASSNPCATCRRCQLEAYAVREREWLKKLKGLRDECDERYKAFDAGNTESEHYLIAAAYAWLSCELSALLKEKP